MYKMCGISGCINKDQAIKSVIRALNKLQNRGYDSAGVSTLLGNKLVVKKYVSGTGENAMVRINSDAILQVDCDIAIGHTRWATHGAKTINNSHPHTDSENRFSLVHNGIIENYLELKSELLNQGITFYGETDTEVIVKYLASIFAKGQTLSDLNSVLHGSWAIVFIDKHFPDKLFFTKNGSPLIVGFNESNSKIMFVSELVGFDSDIKTYIPLEDNDYGYIDMSGLTSTKKYSEQPVPDIELATTPDPFKYWTLREIYDQPYVISKLLSDRLSNSKILFPELNSIWSKLTSIDHIILLGCGTSLHAAHIGSKFFKEFGICTTIEVIDGADFEEMDIPQNKTSVIILLSQSGETKDLYRALQIAKKRRIETIGIINVENSLIAREVNHVLYLKAGREHAVASTKSFTNQTIMLLLLAMWISTDYVKKSKYVDALNNLSADFDSIILKSISETPKFLSFFQNQTDCFILGKQIGEWIAKEGSLKIKEISYIHSEGYSAAALKHGPFALLSPNIPIIMLANDDQFNCKIENVTSEVKSRHANIIYITNKATINPNIDFLFYFDNKTVLFPILSIVPLQVLAYFLALERGNNPDYPRNLAKVVTVE